MSMFAKNLVDLRKEKNLTQKDVGDALGVSLFTVSGWERKGKEPDYDTLIKIALYFNISIDELLGVKEI